MTRLILQLVAEKTLLKICRDFKLIMATHCRKTPRAVIFLMLDAERHQFPRHLLSGSNSEDTERKKGLPRQAPTAVRDATRAHSNNTAVLKILKDESIS